MWKSIFIALLLPISLYAEDCQDCAKTERNDDLIPAWTETFVKEKASDCEKSRAIDELRAEEAVLWTGSEAVETETYGKKTRLKLKGRKEEHELLRKLLGFRTTKKELKKISGCTTALCALSKLYKSEIVARYSLALYKKAGYHIDVGWAYRDWSIVEAKSLYDAVSMLPPSFHRLKTLKVFCKPKVYPLGMFSSGDATSIRKRVRMKDSTDALPTSSILHSFFIHEVAHHYDYTHKPDFDRIGWKDTKIDLGPVSRFFKKRKKDVPSVSEYGKENPFEDFAESVEAYVFNSALMKQYASERYEFMRSKVFKDKAYFHQRMFDEQYAVYRSKHDPIGSILSSCLNEAEVSSGKFSYSGKMSKIPIYNYLTVLSHSECFNSKYSAAKEELSQQYYSCVNTNHITSMNDELDFALRGLKAVVDGFLKTGSCSKEVESACKTQGERFQCLIAACLKNSEDLQFQAFSEANQSQIIETLAQKLSPYLK